ncbi:MAG: hypothetical protein AB1642_13365 [Pseudomonadota bacterium]
MGKKQTSYAPDGVVSERPIALRLLPDERKHAERLASRHNISKGALARLAFNAGLPIIEQQLMKAS